MCSLPSKLALLGEAFANELDFVVNYSTEVHIAKEASMDNPAFNNYFKNMETGCPRA